MNTYNDNLRNNVIATLNTMELELKAMQSETNAAMFSYYYALGASINESEKLGEDKTEMNFREQIKNAAVKVSNVSNNNLNSATQASQCVKQSVSNISVGANNVQVAANAVLQLAGDIGDFLNMASAADRNSSFQLLAVKVNEYVSKTAHDAEAASQLAMEASMFTSKVSAPTVLSNAKAANAGINKLLNTVIGDYAASAQMVSADQLALATLSAKEHLAGGIYTDCKKEKGALQKGYAEANRQVNLALSVVTNPAVNPSAFTVSFKLFKSPFHEKPSKNENVNLYPVQDYYLFVVKEEKQFTFSNSVAQALIDQNKDQQFIDLAADITELAPGNTFKKTFDFTQLNLCDTDGDAVSAGSRYVVFLMAKLWEDYKIKLNSFEDFLSAPSAAFYFTTLMPQVSFPIPVSNSNSLSSLNFWVAKTEEMVVNANPAYRVNFLPVVETGSSLQEYNSWFLFRKILFAERNSDDSIGNNLLEYFAQLKRLTESNPLIPAAVESLQKNGPLWSAICSQALKYYGKDKFSLGNYPVLADTTTWLTANGEQVKDWMNIAGNAINQFSNDETVFFAPPVPPKTGTDPNEIVSSWLDQIKTAEISVEIPATAAGDFFQVVFLLAFIQTGENVQALLKKNMLKLTNTGEKYLNAVVVCDSVLAFEQDCIKTINQDITTCNTLLNSKEAENPEIKNIIDWLKNEEASTWTAICSGVLGYYGKDNFSLSNYSILADTGAWLQDNALNINASVRIANEAIENFKNDIALFFANPVDPAMATVKKELVTSWMAKIKQDSSQDTSAINLDDFFNIVCLEASIPVGNNVITSLNQNIGTLGFFMDVSLPSFVDVCLQNSLLSEIQSFTGFPFNIALAQEVSAGNYTTAGTKNTTVEILEGSCTINDATTDNFGTVLLPAVYYIPAVLSIADIEEESPQSPAYTSVLSFGPASNFIPAANNNS